MNEEEGEGEDEDEDEDEGAAEGEEEVAEDAEVEASGEGDGKLSMAERMAKMKELRNRMVRRTNVPFRIPSHPRASAACASSLVCSFASY